MLFAHQLVGQTVITMPTSGSRTDTLQAGMSYTLVDPGGYGYYPNNCSSTLKLVSDAGTAISISGVSRTEYNHDFLFLYEGMNCNVLMLNHHSGIQNVSQTAYSGKMTLVFTSDAITNNSGFSLTVNVCSVSADPAGNIVVDSITPSSMKLSWDDDNQPGSWTIHYGMSSGNLNSSVTSDTSVAMLVGLAANTTYYYSITHGTLSSNPCDIHIHKAKTSCEESPSACINYSNLASCYVKGTYGTFNNPWQYNGIVNYGSNNSLSRHTVHSNPTETDPRTNNQLLTIPPGYSTSVRLGNWSVGGEAESITYEYHVDSTESDLLLLKYAAVLQVPNHTSSEQPSYLFMILDEEGNEINSSCYSANFVASTSLGWNIYDPDGTGNPNNLSTNAVLWKDWTTVGIDLAPLHGETIYIRLTTRDCSHEQHYGYAYFVLDCSTKSLTAESCGPMPENTFTAPEGFSYRWYKTSEPWTTLSTNRTLHITFAGEYRCELSFVGAPAGADCTFELSAIADSRYPAAIFSWDSLSRDGCDLVVALHNSSVISRDTSRLNLTTLPCDEVEWIIDSVHYSTEGNPEVTLMPGDHTVQLVATLGNGDCTDTATQTITVYNPCYVDDTVETSICSGDTAWLFETPYTDAGTYQGDSVYHHRTLILTVNPKYEDTVTVTLLENQLPYDIGGMSFYNTVYDTAIELSSQRGCDSTIHLSLTVLPNTSSIQDSTVCENELPITWNTVTFHSDSSASVTFIAAAASGADSTVMMTLHVKRNSTNARQDTVVENQLPTYFGGLAFSDDVQDTTFVIQNHLGCDSILTYSLHVWHNIAVGIDSSVCDSQLPVIWNGTTFNSSGSVTVNLSTIGIYATHGEDSILTMTLQVISSSTSYIYDTIVENRLPYTFLDSTFTDAVHNSEFLIQNTQGCDSTIHYSLHVWRNCNIELDSTVCANQLPLVWNGFTITIDDLSPNFQMLNYNLQKVFHTIHGADSSVSLLLTVYPTFITYDTTVICEGGSTPQGFTEAGEQELHLLSVDQCDSTVHLLVVVNPVYHQELYDTICDNQSTIFNGEETSTAGTHEASLVTVDGCDSTLTLHLTVFNTHHYYDRAVVCDGAPYLWIDGNTYTYSTYSPSVVLSDIHGCDSVRHLLLDLNDNFRASMDLSPEIVDLEHPYVHLRDRSESHSRDWYYFAGSSAYNYIDSSRICDFRFPEGEDTIMVLLVARTTAGCIDSVWGSVRSDHAKIWAPNAFTPEESQNNRFFIVSDQLATGHVWIFNREGLIVTHFDAIGGSWDGTYRGKLCPQATYVWKMEYTSRVQPAIKRHAKGTVTLIR